MVLVIQNDPRVPAGLLADALNARGVSHRILPGEAVPAGPPPGCRGVVVLGGYMGVHDAQRHPFLLRLMDLMRECHGRDVPLLGICLGGQLLAAALGGSVRKDSRGEKGVREVALTAAGRRDPLFAGLPEVFPAFQWHNDSFDLPPGALHLAASPVCPGQAFRCRRAYALQFHPEVDEAIVAAWVRHAGADPAHLRAFAAAREELGRCASTLFGNFLDLAGVFSP